MTNRITNRYFKDFQLYKIFIIALTCFFSSLSTFSQQDELVQKANELIYSNPIESIKIAEHILKNSQKNQETAMANLLLSRSYMVKGDYNNAIIHAFNDVNQLKDVDISARIENNILKAALLRKLYLDKQSKEHLNTARELASIATNNKETLQYHIFIEHIKMQLDRRENSNAITEINNAKILFKDFLKNNIDERRSFFLVKERAYNDLNKYDSAFVYINKTLTLLDSAKVNNLFEKAIIYKELGHLHLQKKEFKQSEETFFIALRFAEILDNPFLLKQINRDLAINYLATNQNIQHKVYNDEFLVLNNQIETIEQKSVNTLFNIFSTQTNKSTKAEEKKYNNSFYMVLSSCFLVLLITFFIVLKSKNKKKRLREIISYLEVSKSNFLSTKPYKKTSNKRIIIPEETEQNIILKLKRFENSKKFLNKDLSQAGLAVQFETNTKYLSEIINKHYDENFNTYINKLRIKYIINQLKNDTNYVNYKISYLAEECGYASHSSFATVFKSIVGLSPVTFINLIREEREAEQSKKSN